MGCGKRHLGTALSHAACEKGHSVLFANTIDVINTLRAAQLKGNLQAELRRYLRDRCCGRNIARLRNDLAEQIRVSPRYLRKLEAGVHAPSLPVLMSLKIALATDWLNLMRDL